MITYWTLIIEDGALTLQSHYYTVEVGSSAAAQRAMFYLGGYCSEHGYYFRKRDNEDAIFRSRIAESFGLKVHQLPSMLAKVEHLVSHLKRYGEVPFVPADCHNYDYAQKQTSPTYFFNRNTMCLKRGTK